MWRIIGVFNNIEKEDGTKENLIKIIREESIGNYSWDNKDTTTGAETDLGSNDFSLSKINYLLNPGFLNEEVGGSLYYYAKKGLCYKGRQNETADCDFTSTGLKNDLTRNAIYNVIWNLGAIDSYNDVTPKMFYTEERGNTAYSSTRPTIVIGKIGLMYPSDYGYATSGDDTMSRELCLSKALYYWNEYNACYSSNYLYKNNTSEWTITPSSITPYDTFRVEEDAQLSNFIVVHSRAIRPTLFLKSDISIGIGDGTEANPYQLNI